MVQGENGRRTAQTVNQGEGNLGLKTEKILKCTQAHMFFIRVFHGRKIDRFPNKKPLPEAGRGGNIDFLQKK